MIIKHSTRAKASQFSKLAKYICEDKDNVDDRVLDSWISNLDDEDDYEVASWRIDSQHHSKTELREKGKDMTYHLIISFTDEESKKLGGGEYYKISKKVQESLGLGKHESISAIHGDTNNPHMHLAINLLDKEGKFKEPYLAYKTFQKVREELAAEYGFDMSGQQGKGQNKAGPDRAEKMEVHGNLDSFSSWIKNNVKDELKEHLESGKASWASVHTMLKKKGVGLRKRGNGMVFSHTKEKLFVKASGIDRSFSLGKLQSVLGEFSESKTKAKVAQSYQKNTYKEAKLLYEKYQKHLADIRAKRKLERDQSHKKFKADKKLIAESTKRRKDKILGSSASQKDRSARLKEATFLKAQKMEGVVEAHQLRLKKVKDKYKHIKWNDYLIQEARKGDLQAIAALQAKGISLKETTENHVFNEKFKLVGNTLRGLSCDVKASGEVVYKTKNQEEIRDRGMRLVVGEKYNDEKLEAALKLAISKYGRVLHLRGSEEFKEAMQKKAAEMELGIKFVEGAKTFDRGGRGGR